MKKIIIAIVSIFIFGLYTSAKNNYFFDGKKEIITMKELPTEASKFIRTYWPNAKTISVLKESHLISKEYKVVLDDGTSIEFDQKGAWKEVKNKKGIPVKFILKPITTYITKNFANAVIVEISKDRKSFDVELDIDIELKFNQAGNLIKIDD